jgi:hypothetical protein
MGTCISSDNVQYIVNLFSKRTVSFVSYSFAIFGIPVQYDVCPTWRGCIANFAAFR